MTDTKEIFDEARTNSVWQERPVPDELLRSVYEVAKMGPTSANCCPDAGGLRAIARGQGAAQVVPLRGATWRRR